MKIIIMNKICDCDDWGINLHILNGCIVFDFIHGIDQKLKIFNYCPYCGKQLKEKI